MSLLRLLTSGKSLVGLKKSEPRYHLPGARALPQFGPKKNPFRATVFPEKTEPSPVEASKRQESAAEETGAGEPGKAQELTHPGESAASVVAAAGAAALREAEAPARPATAQAPQRSALRALLLWGRAKKSQVRGSFASRPLVQAELSLDAVKVVRNDLAESDLEVVRVQRSSPKRARNGTEAAPMESAADIALGQEVGRLIGAGKPVS